MKFKTGIKVFAPATVANLGCGFDMLGLALSGLGDEIIIREGKQEGITISSIKGNKTLSKELDKNTAGVAAKATLEYLIEHHGAPSDLKIDLELRKKMPIGSGLGSSAASAVAGAMAINECLGRPLTKRELIPFAAKGEQLASQALHIDNVAPCLLGGIQLVHQHNKDGVYRLPCPKGLVMVVISPKIEILTQEARALLKEEVKLKNAVKQSANAAAFVHALYNTNLDLLKASLTDYLIEPQRAHLIPHFYDIKQAAMNAGALGSSIAGAGPAIFALCMNSFIADNVAEAMTKVWEGHKIKCSTLISPINQEGAELK